MASEVVGRGRVGGALTRYRVVAWIVGVVILVLLLVGVPLQLAGHRGVDRYLGLVHGVALYPLFWLVTLDLAWRTKMPVLRLAFSLVAGTVPFLSFWAERRTTEWVRSP